MANTEKDKVIRILHYALEMESAGRQFFKEKAEVFANATTRDMFLKLADMELEHYKLIKRELEKYTSDPENFKVGDNVLTRDETTFFDQREESESLDTTLVESNVPDLTVIRMAYLIERDYKEFYQETSEMVEDENVKELLFKLAHWEDGHEKLFKKEYDRLKKEYMNLPWGG